MARKGRRLWTQSVILGGILFGGYLIYNNVYKPYRDSTSESPRTATSSKRGNTKCIIVNGGSVNEKIEWVALLSDPSKDIIVLVTPECKQQFVNIVASLPIEHRYKIIYCDTVEGVWSCVRSVRKLALYLMPGMVVPDDIRRYTPEVVLYDMNTTHI